MAGAIGRGDFVECVDAAPVPGYRMDPRLRLGAVYRVRRVWVTASGEHLLAPVEIPNPFNSEGGFYLHRFRLVYRRDEKLIASLLVKQPDVEPVGS